MGYCLSRDLEGLPFNREYHPVSQIFLSHSNKDKKISISMAKWLMDQGHFSLFLDFDPAHGIAAGKRWEDEIYQQLRNCSAMIALVSPNWLESRWCFAEATQARAAGKPLFIVKVENCSTKELFEDVQHMDLTEESATAYQLLARGLKEAGIEPGEAFTWDRSRPLYPGLNAFQEKDAAVFFGRNDEIGKILGVLNSTRRTKGPPLILLLGASGSGKSSLMRAGLIPRVRKDKQAWLPLSPFRPQQNPMEELAGILAQAFNDLKEPRGWHSIYNQLYESYVPEEQKYSPNKESANGKGLKNLAGDLRILADQQDATVLLAIDQAEELFGYSDVEKSMAFLECVSNALKISGNRLMVIATIRSDTFSSFQTKSNFEDFMYQTIPISPIPKRNLPQVIEGPAKLANVKFESGLISRLVGDAETDDALPLLAFTLRELYERYGKDRRLEIQDYEDLGGLEGSVRRAANEIIERKNPSEETLNIFRQALIPAMVRITEEGKFVRRHARWQDLPSRAHDLLDEFVEARLIISDGKENERVIEVAHEALFRAWPMLEGWLHEDRNNLIILDDLRRSAEKWEEGNQKKTWLVHHGERLLRIEKMLQSTQFAHQINNSTRNYLDACRKKQRRAKVTATIIGFAAVLAISGLGFGLNQVQVAEEQRKQLLSSRLSTESRLLTDEGQPTLGTLIALEALSQNGNTVPTHVPNAEAALLHALFQQREKHILHGHSEGINQVQFSSDGSLVVTASGDQTAMIWNTATGKTNVTLVGHNGQIYDAGFSRNNKKVVTASSDGTAKIWSVETGETLETLKGHTDQVYISRFSQDGTRVLTASADGTAQLWNSETGERSYVLEGHSDQVFWAEFSQDGKRVVTASADQTAGVWDIERGKRLLVLTGHEGPILHAAFSPDGQRIITTSWDKNARLWDGKTGETLAILEGHEDGVDHAAFSPDGSQVVTTSADKTARLWDGKSGEPLGILKGHKGYVYDAQFTQDGKWLITASEDKTARLWNVATHEMMDIYGSHKNEVLSAQFSPDGKLVATASADSTARVWKVAPNTNMRVLRGHKDRVHKVNFSLADSSNLVTVSDDGQARIWDGKTGEIIHVLQAHKEKDWYAVFSNDGKHLLTTSTNGKARLWNSRTGNLRHTFSGHKGLVFHAHFSPDGNQVVTAGSEGSAKVWDVESGQLVSELSGHHSYVNFAEFSGDGKHLVTASQDKTARLWDASSFNFIASLTGHNGPIINAAFSPDSNSLATVSGDKTIRVWNAKTGNFLRRLTGHTDEVLSVGFSSDNKLLVTGSSDTTARLWDIMTGQMVRVLQGHDRRINDVSFSPDGRMILTASSDRTARLWHVASGLSVAILKGHHNEVLDAAFSSDGYYVATASWDNTARLWTLPVGNDDDWVSFAKQTLLRQLTEEETQLYLSE